MNSIYLIIIIMTFKATHENRTFSTEPHFLLALVNSKNHNPEYSHEKSDQITEQSYEATTVTVQYSTAMTSNSYFYR